MIEPSTPPLPAALDERGYPYTPATPKYGSLDDAPSIKQTSYLEARKTVKMEVRTPVQNLKSPIDRNLNWVTPRTTPCKRVPFKPATTPSRGSGRSGRRLQTKPDDDLRLIVNTKTVHIPPKSSPPTTGMWYVFRGKRVFRPFGEGQTRMKPVRLFSDEGSPETSFGSSALCQTVLFERESGKPVLQLPDSEDDTDVEW